MDNQTINSPITIQTDNLDNIINYLPATLLPNYIGSWPIIENQVFEDCECNGTRFSNIFFKNCQFIKCDFRFTDMSGVEFNNCNFTLTSIKHSSLHEIFFSKCKGSLNTIYSRIINVSFGQCDLSEFSFVRNSFECCNFFDIVKLNWDCSELIAQVIYENSIYTHSNNQQLKDLIAIIKSSGRCHNELRNYQHFARKEAIQLLADYIKNENDLSVPKYLKEELAFIEKENENGNSMGKI